MVANDGFARGNLASCVLLVRFGRVCRQTQAAEPGCFLVSLTVRDRLPMPQNSYPQGWSGCSSSAAFCVQYGVQRLRIRGEPWPKYDYSRSCIRAIRDHGPMRWLALRRATMLSDAQNMPSNTIRRSATQTHVPRGRSAPRGHHGRAERVLPSGQCASKHLGRELRYRISQLGVIHRPQGRPQLLRCHHTQQPVVNRGRGRLRCRRRGPAGQLG